MSTPGVLEMASYKRGQIPIKSVQQEITDALESGVVVSLPNLDFPLSAEESALLDPRILSTSKNVSYAPATGKVAGTSCIDKEKKRLQEVMGRFARTARDLVGVLVPIYKEKLEVMRTSLRPVEVAGRAISWRQDDTRLHVDAFPSQPTGGDRILRIFCNVNPSGKPRVWRLGEPFEDVARRFVPKIPQPFPGSALLKYALRLTKTMGTEYDHIMLRLHDAMKSDEAYQRSMETEPVEFKPGTTWICFSDSVSHAALSGQHQLEQTIFVPVDAMWDTKKSPLKILERLKNRDLD
ncbi:MAG: Kdo hydroxylase family protein [Opitutaceae bacterium]|jgi:hypothetical protein